MQIARIWKLLVWVHVHVLAMDALFHTQLLTFRKERGQICCFYALTLALNSSRQINIDYAICQALGYNTHRLKEALIAYDVACQWSINFDERVDHSAHLLLPSGLAYIPAVGKFHLAAHREDCFAQFSLNFVQGAGQQDGEVLETLWSSLNKAAGSIRAMTKAHRQEMLDEHILDSNWKKLVNMGMLFACYQSHSMLMCASTVNSLKRKYARALPAQQESLEVFEELDKSLNTKSRKEWEMQEAMAMEYRGDYLNVYNVKSEKGELFPLNKQLMMTMIHICLCCNLVPAIHSALSATTSLPSKAYDHTTLSWLQTGVTLDLEQ
jgi:hypothetical protein